MIGFPNLDAVERHMNGQAMYQPPNSGVAVQEAPAQTYQAYPVQQPQAPVVQSVIQAPSVVDIPLANQSSITTIMLTDGQFNQLMGCLATQPIIPAMTQNEVSAVLANVTPAPDGAGNEGNIVDVFGNLTFGTVNRAGKTVTTLINNMLDIVTFGYGVKQ